MYTKSEGDTCELPLMSLLLLSTLFFSVTISTNAVFSTYLELRNGAHEGMSEWSTILEDLLFLAQTYRDRGLVLVEPCIKDAQLVGCHIGGSFPVSFAYNLNNYGSSENQTSKPFNWITWKERNNKKLHKPDSLYHINCKMEKKFGGVLNNPLTKSPSLRHRYLQQGGKFPLPRFAKTIENQSRIENCVRKVVNMKGITNTSHLHMYLNI